MRSLAVIGGSGLYEMPGLTGVDELRVSTPFGDPSDAIVRGWLADTQLFFLPRHGRGHRLLPSEINYRANIFALKMLGAEYLLAVAAVGSLRYEIAPGHLIVPDQFIDRTTSRASTFFGRGVVAHVSMADPVCATLSRVVAEAARTAGGVVHDGGAYLCIEGPQFSSRAESQLYRSWGAAVIGMTNVQEAKLAREAEMCFATLALASDYDCWHTDHRDVSIDDILRILNENVDLARRSVAELARTLPDRNKCGCKDALRNCIITNPRMIPDDVKEQLAPIVGKYLGLQGRE